MNRPDWKSRPLRLWILAAFLRALSWIGVRIDLLVIVREGETPIDVPQSPDDYDYGFVSAADIEELAHYATRFALGGIQAIGTEAKQNA